MTQGQEGAARGRRRGDDESADGSQQVSEDIFPAIAPDEGAAHDRSESGLADIEPIIGTVDHTPESAKTITRIEIPYRTIVLVVGTIFLIWVLLQVWGILLQIFLAFLLATALMPLVRRLQNRGLPKAAAAGLVFVGVIGLIAGFFGIVVPPLVQQVQSFIDNAPAYLERFEGFIRRYPSLWEQYQQLRDNGLGGEQGSGGGAPVPVGEAVEVTVNVVSGIANTFFVLVLTFYLMLEGDRTWAFLSRYFTPRLRYRLQRSYPEIARVVSGYVIGQSINSLCFGLFAFVTMAVLGVPEPLLLGVLAAVLDAVPIVGVPVATIPAVLLALTVSWQTALLVLALYIAYQQFENYVLVPRVFGNTLQVSALSILVGVLVGGQLLGVIGIILALPITASIPVLERVWNEPLPDSIEDEEA